LKAIHFDELTAEGLGEIGCLLANLFAVAAR